MRGSRGRKRDHRRLGGTRRRRSRPDQACLQVGDGRPSNNVIRQLSQPDHLHTCENDASGVDTRDGSARATRSGPSRVRRANETGLILTAFRGTRRGRLSEWPILIHTYEIDVMGLHRRSNTDGVDLDRVDKWLDCIPGLCHSTGDGPVFPEPRRRCWVQLARRLTGNGRQRTAAQSEKLP
jgi:hypothetical protein